MSTIMLTTSQAQGRKEEDTINQSKTTNFDKAHVSKLSSSELSQLRTDVWAGIDVTSLGKRTRAPEDKGDKSRLRRQI